MKRALSVSDERRLFRKEIIECSMIRYNKVSTSVPIVGQTRRGVMSLKFDVSSASTYFAHASSPPQLHVWFRIIH